MYLNMYVAIITLSYAYCTFMNNLECHIPQSLMEQIHSYQPVVDKITNEIIGGPFAGLLYKNLVSFVDKYGARLVGSYNLENAINYVIKSETAAGLVVTTQQVEVPSWTRGQASATVIYPFRKKLSILALGGTPSTPVTGITAEAMVVKDFNELKRRKGEVPGKLVVFNPKFKGYAKTVSYRNIGPYQASKLGAILSFVRSVTDMSLNSPHAGVTYFANESYRIPAASITVENANYIERLLSDGFRVLVNYKSSAKRNPNVTSRNIIADIPGASKPEEYVVVSGHIDSWDISQGVQDDAGGSFLAWHCLAVIKAMNLMTPKRTLRAVLFTAEEYGALGALAYRRDRENELKNWTLAIESDWGIYRSSGLWFTGNDEATCIMQEIFSMFKALNATEIKRRGAAGSDIQEFKYLGIPLAEPYYKQNNYLYYHHSPADWVEAVNEEDLDQNLAILTSAIYVIANLNEALPKGEMTPKKRQQKFINTLYKQVFNKIPQS